MLKPIIIIISLFSTISIFAQGECNFNFTLGNDVNLGCAQPYIIQAPQGVNFYEWGDGSTADTLLVEQSGTYTCQGTILGTENLVVNGDFSDGATGFSSDYIPGTGGSWGLLSLEGQYAVSSNSSLVHNNFANCYDHTVGNSTGKMMIVNGASTPNVEIWEQTITIEPNTDYQFSAWGMSVTPSNPGQLQFSINGVQLGNIMTLSSTTCDWQQFFVNWNSGTNTTAVIAIVNQNNATSGNDFAIDDIHFNSICVYEDSIEITMPDYPVVNIPPQLYSCEGDPINITATSDSPNMTYSWNNGEMTGSTITISPTENTEVTVIGMDENGCNSLPDTTNIDISNYPTSDITGDTILCENLSTYLVASSDIPNSTFLWLDSQTQNDSLNIEGDLNTNAYIVEVTSPQGCTTLDTFNISIVPALIINIDGDTSLCDGDNGVLQASSNLSNTSYEWLPFNVTASVKPITIADTGWVYLVGNHPVCGSTTDSVFITNSDIPTVYPPMNDTICFGDQITVQASSDQEGAEITWTPINATGNSMNLSPEYTTTYYLQAINGNCISEEVSFEIVVNPICDLIVPNVLTPNGDQINDSFHLVSYDGISTLECIILNRWGNIIAEYNTPDFQWDGTNKSNKEVSDGTYFYKMKATLSNGKLLEKSGHITLIRE